MKFEHDQLYIIYTNTNMRVFDFFNIFWYVSIFPYSSSPRIVRVLISPMCPSPPILPPANVESLRSDESFAVQEENMSVWLVRRRLDLDGWCPIRILCQHPSPSLVSGLGRARVYRNVTLWPAIICMTGCTRENNIVRCNTHSLIDGSWVSVVSMMVANMLQKIEEGCFRKMNYRIIFSIIFRLVLIVFPVGLCTDLYSHIILPSRHGWSSNVLKQVMGWD